MLRTDLAAPATVVILPPHPGAGMVSQARADGTLAGAVRFVVEELPASERPRAVVRTAAGWMFSDEIEAIYDHFDEFGEG